MSKKDTDVGKETEQMVARWWRSNGFPSCERRVKTGYRVPGRESPDEGDLINMIGICSQIKSLRPATRMELAVPGWMAETEAQRIASRASLGFLVVRRWGTTDVGRWWVFQRLDQLTVLAGSAARELEFVKPIPGRSIPVRMDMAALSGLLQLTGWAGAEPTEEVS